MLETTAGSKYSGKFTVDNREIDGEITFSGKKTQLLLHSSEFFIPENINNQCIHGTLLDRTLVSLFNCLTISSGSRWTGHLKTYETATIKPHFVVHGGRHLMPTEKLLKSMHFVLCDAPVIFPDYNSFSTAHQTTPNQLRSLLIEKNKITKRHTRIGRHPIIAYFTGNHQIFKSKTILGEISAHHRPSYKSGGPNGISITNEIATQIVFPKAVTFAESLNALGQILSFFEIIAARRQEIKSLYVILNGKDKLLSTLEVYSCYAPQRKRQGDEDPHPIDLPINAAQQPKAFGDVLANWLARHNTWKSARHRFSDSFTEENKFSLDRLIGSANMFDLLPESAIPQSVSLSKDLLAARDVSKKLFKSLPESAERNSMLAALGRLGHASLKQKVGHRAEIVINELRSELPNLSEVLDLAVDARNHFVHGTDSKIDYASNFFETVAFFTTALEFVFVVSDLLEAGWDIQRWKKQGSTLSHPFASFLYNYHHRLDRLRGVLPSEHRLRRGS